MNKCIKCEKEDLRGQLHCMEESCPYLQPGGLQELVEAADGHPELIPAEAEWIPDEVEEPAGLFSEPQEKAAERVLRQVKLPNGRIITLNDQQVEALELMFKYQDDRGDLFFVLSGFAGTGKTTIVKEALKRWAARSPYGFGSVGVTAPTHKAKKVISDATGIQGNTIQSLLGLAPNVELADFDINKPEFAAKKKPTIEHYRLLVLDEGSMINKDLWKMLKEQAKRYNVKLITMLDEAQLPPVKEHIAAPVIDPEIVYKYQLTKVERQAGDNPLMPIYDAIREDTTSLNDRFHHETNVIKMEDGTEIGARFLPDIMDFGRAAIKEFMSEAFQQDKNHCKIICWTNQRIQFWNGSVRKTLLGELAKKNIPQEQLLHAQTIMPDELLMGYSSYTDGIENSGEYQVVQLQYAEKNIEFDIKYERGLKVSSKTVTYSGYRVAMMDVDQNTMINAFIIDPDIEEEKKFTEAFNWYLWHAKVNKQWPTYYAFKAENLLMRDIKDNRGTLVCKKDLDYAYALTVHKSQGSSYDQVFVDEGDINKNRNHVERNKLKYVAFSRPRYLATILTGG